MDRPQDLPRWRLRDALRIVALGTAAWIVTWFVVWMLWMREPSDAQASATPSREPSGDMDPPLRSAAAPAAVAAREELEALDDAGIPERVERDGERPSTGSLEPVWMRFVAAQSRRPVAGVRLPEGAVSDGDGRASHPVPTDGAILIRVTADGYAPQPIALTGGTHGTPEEALEIRLVQGAVLRGRLIDGDDHALEDATVTLVLPLYDMPQPHRGAARINHDAANMELEERTATDGQFRFADLPPRVTLRVALQRRGAPHSSREFQSLALAPGEERVVTWRLAGRSAVAGTVSMADGTPAEGATVRLLRFGAEAATSRCAVDGSFRLDDVAAGEWELEARPLGDGVAGAAVLLVTVPEGRALEEVTLTLPPTAPLRVRVVGPDGAPRVGVFVYAALAATGESTGSTRTDADGVSTIWRRPFGDYRVSTRQADPTLALYQTAAFHHDGQRECLLRLEPGGRLSGTVVGAESRALTPPPSVWFRRRGAEDHWFRTEPDERGAAGAFTSGWMQAGTYDLVATLDDDRIGVLSGVEVAAGEERTDLVIEARPGAWLRVCPAAGARTMVGGQRRSLRVGCEEAILHEESLSAAGGIALLVPAGRIRLDWILDGDVEMTLALTTVPGDERILDLTFD